MTLRNPLRRLAGVVLFAISALALGATDAAKRTYDLPAGDAATTLKQFTDQSGAQVVYLVNSVRGVATKPVQGEMTAKDALNRMLADTPLVVVQDEKTGALTVNRSSDPNASRAAQPDSARPEKANATEEKVAKLEEVEVTGSRIRTLVGEQTAMPVISLNQIELEERGVTRLADIRWAIPQLGANIGFNDNLSNSGPSRAQQVSTSFSLRGLGGNATLILIDGQRVPHTGQGAPGGAGGREDFNVDGIPISAIERIDILPQGAGAIYGAEAIAGVINIVLKKNYTGAEMQVTYDSPFRRGGAQRTGTLTGGYRAGKLSTFFTVSQTDQAALASRDRWFTYPSSASSLAYTPYAGPGTLATGYYPASSTVNLPGLSTPVVGIPSGSTGTTAANATAGAIGSHYDLTNYSNQIDPARTRSVVFKSDYDYQPWLQPYLSVRWSEFRNFYTGTPLTLTTQLPVGYPGNPFSSPVYLSKVFYDLPVPSITSEQINSGLNLGLKGQLPHDWHYDAGFTWAQNVSQDHSHNTGFNFTALSQAVNSANKPILAYDSSVVRDPSGLVAGLIASSSDKNTTDISVYSINTDGTIWTDWAGDVKLAVGAEAQEESVKFYTSPAISYLLSVPYSRRTNAAYSEVSIPLLSDQQHLPLVHRLEVDGAYRSEHLSDLGGDTTPSMSAFYQPVSWLTFRGSRTEGFKAPTLYDLQAPQFSSTTTIRASSGVVDTLLNNQPVVGTYTLTTGGQPNLKPERSTTRNFGIVLDVPKVKGLSASVDFWDLDFINKTGTPSYQNLINFFPSRVIRAPSTGGTPGVITGFDDSTINQASVKTKGVDYRLSYRRSTGYGEFLVSGALSSEQPQISVATPSSLPSVWPQPKRASGSLFWARGPWGAGISVNYQSSFPAYAGAVHPYPSYIEWDPQVSYDFGHRPGDSIWGKALADVKLSLTVINAFDKQPSAYEAANDPLVQDPRLSRYILTLTKKF